MIAFKKCFPYFLSILFFSCDSSSEQQLNIAVATSMETVAKAMCKEFTREKGIACTCISGSSGKLMAQISAGAPYDIFLSANSAYTQKLYNQELSGAPIHFANGRLLLWSAMENVETSMESLLNQDVQHIALANPRLAPYGLAALEVLQHFQLLDKLQAKLVFGENLAQSNQFILSGAAELGFTSLSTFFGDDKRLKGKWVEVDSRAYSPIQHTGVLVYNAKETEKEGKAFLNFIASEKGRGILEKWGYDVLNIE